MTVDTNDPVFLAEKIEALIENPDAALQDDDTRRRLREAGSKLSRTMENRGDTVYRLAGTPLQLALARVGMESGLFEILDKRDGSPVSAGELARLTKIDLLLLQRILRYYQSTGMISQLGEDAFIANNITKAVAPTGAQSGLHFYFEMISPSWMVLPKYFRKNDYRNPTDAGDCPWHLGHSTSESPFQWMQSRPDNLKNFLRWMTVQREGLPIFLDSFDFKDLLKDVTADTDFFVDIGGAVGHQCVALRMRFPDLAGRVILQDSAKVIEQVKARTLPGVKPMVYDFFTPQPIKGARVYYMRNILHNWPDDKCKEILQNTKSAMTKDSVYLIDDIVVPVVDCSWRTSQRDMAMMASLAAVERTEAEWTKLLDTAGLKIREIHEYSPDTSDSIIVAVPK